MNKVFFFKVLLSMCAILLFFAVLEISIRLLLFSKSRKSFEHVMADLPELKPDVPATLGEIVIPSRYPGIIYELRPHIKANFMNVQLETNSEGWRGKLYPVHKDKNTVRIVTLGDSHMFGWGVPEDKRYSNALEDELNAKFPGRKWEVINTAVPGYNTYMEVETLQRKALAYSPDIVIMEYIGNDLDLPNFITDSTDCLNLRKSFLVDFLKGRIGSLSTDSSLVGAPIWFREGAGPRNVGEHDISLVPERYRYMVGWDSYARSMMKLKKMQEESHFDVVVLISHDDPPYVLPKIMKLCSDLKFYCLFSLQRYEPPTFLLSKGDLHPSAMAHQVIKDNLFDFMTQMKIFLKYVEKQ